MAQESEKQSKGQTNRVWYLANDLRESVAVVGGRVQTWVHEVYTVTG